MNAKNSLLTCLAFALVFAMFGQTALATSGVSPYVIPVVVDSNPDPNVVETTIVVEEAMVDIGNGVMAHAHTFNGAIPGPEFRLKVGDTVIVYFENHTEHPTGIHWHGIELNNASDGTPLSQNQVPENGTFLYKFTITRPGIFWYHPHHHASTNQLFRGLYGPIIVTDPHEAELQAAGVLPPESQTLTLALSDTTVCKAPGFNDAATYTVGSMTWQDGMALPAQLGPQPDDLCELAPFDDDGMSMLPETFDEGEIPNIQPDGTSGRVNEGQTVLTNGMNVGGRAGSPSAPGALAPGAATYDVLAGQGLRLHIGNAATVRFFRLRLTDSTGMQIPLVRVGGQGGLLDDAVVDGGIVGAFDFKYGAGEILLDPGDRADVVAAIPPAATGVLTLWTMDFMRTGPGGTGFSNIPTVPVMHLNVTGMAAVPYTIMAGTALRSSIAGAAVETLGAPTGVLLDPDAFVPAKDGCSPLNVVPCTADDIQLTQVGGTSLGVDGVIGGHDFPGVDYTNVPHFDSARYAEVSDILEMTVTNTTGAHHPFHLHGFSIQPIDLTRPAFPTYTFPYSEFRDNIDVPADYTLRYRIRLDDRPLMDGITPGGALGRWVFHCHIFFHASFGMISEFVVADPDGNERPNVNALAASIEINEGQTAMMDGTYDDPDGDAITLAGPAVGALIDNANGTWSWSFATTDGPDNSQFLYTTATDASLRKNQVAFALVVNNLPPTATIASPPNGSTFTAPASVPVTASVTDPGTGDALSCTFDWGDGSPTTVAAVVAGSCSASHNFAQAGVFNVTVTASDDDGGISAPALVMIDTQADSDGDGVADPSDGCPNDPLKTSPGACGCGNPDADLNNNGTADCADTDDGFLRIFLSFLFGVPICAPGMVSAIPLTLLGVVGMKLAIRRRRK
ncbi:MAG TPA: multicopper oxidase domain-containing protein [Phycisphaerae bacterium]|nr:multicopper oxidase domain-containing protein [Phycisphaerae bacterium]